MMSNGCPPSWALDKIEFAYNTEKPFHNAVTTMWWKACARVALIFLFWFFSLFVHAKGLEYSASIGDKLIGVIVVEAVRDGRLRFTFHPHPELGNLSPSSLYLSDRFSMNKRVAQTFGTIQDNLLLPLDSTNLKGSSSYRAPSVPAPYGLEITYYHSGSFIALFQLSAVVDIWIDQDGLVTAENMLVNQHGQLTGESCMAGSYFLPAALAGRGSTASGDGPGLLSCVCFPLMGIGQGTLVRATSEVLGNGGQNHDVTVSVSDTNVDLFIMVNPNQIIESIIMNLPDGQNTITVILSSSEDSIIHFMRAARDAIFSGKAKKRQMD